MPENLTLPMSSFPLIFLRLELASWALLVLVFAVSAQTLPGCQDHCGNISIPYPFGTSKECYIEEHFLVTCNHTNDDPPKLFLETSTTEILDIFLSGELHISSDVAFDCYTKQGLTEGYSSPWFTLTKFHISNTRNKFTAVGCDTVAYVEGSYGQRYSTGCLSICDSIDSVISGSCSGSGCCQTSIPKAVWSSNTSVRSYHNHTFVWDFNPCSYAFIAEETAYNFSSLDLIDFQNRTTVPMVVDWAVGDQTCDEARKNLTSYACKDNSDCYDFDNGPGYRCNCTKGFQGNPYIPQGCQDIDECSAVPSPCSGTCHNLPGSYNCFCPQGYEGDSRRDGLGCRIIPSHNKKRPLIIIAIGLSSGIGALFLIIATWWLYKVQKKRNDKKRKEKFFERNGGLLLQQQLSSSDGSVQKPKLFHSKELEKATDHYNEDRILGQGGQGTVYKGMLSDGRIVAIKKSKIVDEGNVEQFINEVVILSQIIHRNVVKLLGCCLETEVPLVVYEFISNGTLFELIHDPNEDFPLSWDIRLRIAIEVAEALSYLHYAASVPIYHRDIKSTNILLDDKYRAKVSDFGTSKSVAIDQTHFTTRVQGTYGYLDPEYFQSSQFTEKSDVYSFGVVIVELLTGRKPISSNKSQETKSLATFFLQSMEDDCLFEIIDQKIMKEDWREEIVAVAYLAKRCLNLNGKKRPTMKDVAVELEGIRMLRQNTTTQQNYEVFEYNKTDFTEVWDVASTSTGTCFDSTIVSSFDDKPLLLNEL